MLFQFRSETFTVVFDGWKIFGRKTAQLTETLRESVYSELASENRLRNLSDCNSIRPSTRVDWLVRIWSIFTVPGSDKLIQVLDFRRGIAVGVCLGYQHREAV